MESPAVEPMLPVSLTEDSRLVIAKEHRHWMKPHRAAPPRPWTARPMMSILIDVDSAHRTAPADRIHRPNRIALLRPMMSEIGPISRWPMVMPSRKEDTTLAVLLALQFRS